MSQDWAEEEAVTLVRHLCAGGYQQDMVNKTAEVLRRVGERVLEEAIQAVDKKTIVLGDGTYELRQQFKEAIRALKENKC